MRNTRKKNIVVYIITESGEKLYFKRYINFNKREWTKDVNLSPRYSIGEARRKIANTLYNHNAGYEIVE